MAALLPYDPVAEAEPGFLTPLARVARIPGARCGARQNRSASPKW